jgi:hydroxypyruvate isomerase
MLDEITRGSATLAAAGGDVLLLNSWASANPPEYDDLYTAFLRDASEQAARYGVKLGMEHIVGSKWRNRAVALFELAEKVDRPNVGVYFDIANSLAVGEDPVAAARTIAPRLIQFHVKDHPASGRSLEAMPLREIKAVLDAAGYTGRVATEIEPFEEAGEQTNAHLVSALTTLRQIGY